MNILLVLCNRRRKEIITWCIKCNKSAKLKEKHSKNSVEVSYVSMLEAENLASKKEVMA